MDWFLIKDRVYHTITAAATMLNTFMKRGKYTWLNKLAIPAHLESIKSKTDELRREQFANYI